MNIRNLIERIRGVSPSLAEFAELASESNDWALIVECADECISVAFDFNDARIMRDHVNVADSLRDLLGE